LWQTQDFHEGLDVILAAAIDMVAADKGNMQLLDTERGVLHIAIHRGFEQPFLEYFREVSSRDDSACGRALRGNSQIVIEDVETDEGFGSMRPIARAAGYRAVISTPMFGRAGKPLGMISTHFRDPRRPGEQELRRLELYARRAADFIERWRIEEALRTSDEQLRKLNESLERQVAERTQALQEREARLRRMMENAHVGIAFGDSQGHINQANRTMMELVGWSEEDLHAGRINCRAICRPEDLEQDLRAMTELATHGRVGPAEKILRRTNGAEIPVLISAFRLDPNSDENVTFVVDLRPQKRVEEDLRDREARLRAILDAAADAIITINHRGIIQSVNPATERMFGYAAAEMVGQNVTMLMSSPYREAHDGYMARYLQTGEKHIIGICREVDARRKDGSIFPTDLTVSEVPHLKLFTGVHRDLTQRKQLERDVVEIATLEQQRIGQDLHDDCGQELTALGIMVDSLAPSLDQGGAPDKEVVQKIALGVQRVLRRVRSLAQGLARAEVEPADLRPALAELTSRVSEMSGMRCTLDFDEAAVVVDRLQATHLYHIAQEACTNVLRHSQAKQAEVSLRTVDHALVLRIQDDGMGMRSDQTRGLGLRIMHNRSSLIGARLTIEPVQPSGTLVTCVLPQAMVRV
jgi:PAS domain S-box-containing protein